MSHRLGHWSKVRVRDIAAPKKYALNGGPFGSKLVSSDYTPEGVPVIRGSNLTGDTSFSFDDFVYVSEEKADELFPNNAHPGDLIITQRGTLGQVGLIPKECDYDRFVVSQSQMKLTVDEAKADPYFVYLYFRSPLAVQTIKNLTITSGVPHINLELLRNLEIPLPPLDTQRRVADILSAYDDLIANNNRRMTLLEESIHRLYREWFVRLRFPGYERVKVVNDVPEGWEKATIEALLEFHTGGGWGADDFDVEHSESAFVIRGTDIDAVAVGDISKLPFRYHKESNLKSRRLQDGDIIFEVSGGSKTQGVGRALRVTTEILNLLSDDVICASFCKLLRLYSRDLVEYFFLYLNYSRETNLLTQYENQSASNIINFKFTNFINSECVLIPPTKTLEEFNLLIRPLFDQTIKLGTQNQKLREARDLLLPRLMNGDIVV